MPPFGNLYGMDVFVDQALAEDEEIAFNAGSHRELVRMRFADFRGLVNPAIIRWRRAKPTRTLPECCGGDADSVREAVAVSRAVAADGAFTGKILCPFLFSYNLHKSLC